MIANDLEFTEIYYAINLAILAASFFISILLSKFVKSIFVRFFIITSIIAVFTFALLSHGKQHTSKYKTFDIKRCANKREIMSRFRSWSKVVHPDSQLSENQAEGLSYEELDSLKDFLSDSTKRLFYDKFNMISERQDFDEKESKEIYNALFQTRLFEYLNLTFAWIFITFLVSKYLKKLELTNFILKILIAKSFMLIYYLYSQELDSCSAMDSLFGHLTIAQQIYFSEFWFSFVFGLAVGQFNGFVDNQKKRALEKIDQAMKVLQNRQNKSPTEEKLLSNIKSYYEYLNN